MTAKEMFELAKAGYKPSEIAEMHKLMKDADIEAEPQPKEEPKEEPKADPEPQPKEEPKEEPELDYKKLYEESQQKIASIQKQNLSQNIGAGDKNDEDILAAAIRGFM